MQRFHWDFFLWQNSNIKTFKQRINKKKTKTNHSVEYLKASTEVLIWKLYLSPFLLASETLYKGPALSPFDNTWDGAKDNSYCQKIGEKVGKGKGRRKRKGGENLEMRWEAFSFFTAGVWSGFPEHKLEKVMKKQEITNAASVSGVTLCWRMTDVCTALSITDVYKHQVV